MSLLCYVMVTLNGILKIAPGSFWIAPGSCQIPMNQAQFWNANCPWFPPAYFKAWSSQSNTLLKPWSLLAACCLNSQYVMPHLACQWNSAKVVVNLLHVPLPNFFLGMPSCSIFLLVYIMRMLFFTSYSFKTSLQYLKKNLNSFHL